MVSGVVVNCAAAFHMVCCVFLVAIGVQLSFALRLNWLDSLFILVCIGGLVRIVSEVVRVSGNSGCRGV